MALFMDIHDIEGGVAMGDVEKAHAVHREAHGLVADAIFEVSEGV